MRPSLDDLSVFVAVARTASISRAATDLGLPKSSVSRALARVEGSMGVELVHRTTRRSRLTTAGEALLARAEPLVRALEDAVAELPEREATPAGKLRITCTIDFAAVVVAAVVSRFVARWPAVSVEVHSSNAVVDLVGGGFDLGVRFSPKGRLPDSTLVARRVGTLRTHLVASPAYLARRGTPRSPKDLAAHEWITYRGAESIVLEAPGRAAKLAARGRIVGDDMFFVRAAAREGAGIAELPSFLAEPDIAAGVLTRVLPRLEAPSGAIWLVQPPSRVTPPKIAAFRALLAEALAR
jgi:DNA-binding transcriptional LysR family regulator